MAYWGTVALPYTNHASVLSEAKVRLAKNRHFTHDGSEREGLFTTSKRPKQGNAYHLLQLPPDGLLGNTP
jgi:hypothetical protein